MFLLSGQPTIQLLNNFKLSLRILLHCSELKCHGCDTMSLGVWLLALQGIVAPSSKGKSSPGRKSLFLNWRWRHLDPLKCLHRLTQHNITLQDTWILSNTTGRPSNLGYCMAFQSSLNTQSSNTPCKRPSHIFRVSVLSSQSALMSGTMGQSVHSLCRFLPIPYNSLHC